MTINFATSALGYLRIVICDENGEAIDGYDSGTLFGDSIERPVDFSNSLSDINGRAVKLKIYMSECDLYSVTVDWFDAFHDETELYNRIVSAVDRGVLEKEDELRWLYPNMTDEEITQKLARIQANSQTNTDMALERILQGG
jgi:hypothetical protein